jgi:hypothetical protein
VVGDATEETKEHERRRKRKSEKERGRKEKGGRKTRGRRNRAAVCYSQGPRLDGSFFVDHQKESQSSDMLWDCRMAENFTVAQVYMKNLATSIPTMANVREPPDDSTAADDT